MRNIKAKIYPMEKSDWVKFFYLLYRYKSKELWIGFIGAIFILITILLVFIAQLISGKLSSQIYIFAVIAFFLLIFIFAIDYRIRGIAQTSVDPNSKPVYYIIDDSGFSKLDSHENNKSMWADFKEAIISKNNILLFDNENIISFISKNYTEEEFEQIKIWVDNNIKII